MSCCSASRCPRACPRATPSTRSRGGSWSASTPRPTPTAAAAHFERVFVQGDLPEEIEEASFSRAGRRRPHAGPDRRELRRLALGRAAQARPGRGQARRRGAGRRRTSIWPPSASTARCCRSASAASGACAGPPEQGFRGAVGPCPPVPSGRLVYTPRCAGPLRPDRSPSMGLSERYTGQSCLRVARDSMKRRFREESPPRERATVFENSTACALGSHLAIRCASRFDPSLHSRRRGT